MRIVTYYAPVVIAVPMWTPANFDEAAGQKWHVFEPRMSRNVAIRRCFIHQRVSEGWTRRLMKNCPEEEKILIDRINRHFGLAPDCKDSGMMFAALRLRGEHVEVTDTTVLGAMNAVLLHGCRSARLAGNTLRSGTGGVCLMMCGYRPWPAQPDSPPIRGSYLREVLVEGNSLVSRADRSRNGSFFYQSGMHCHMARNRIEDASRDSDGEAAGCHLWMERWLGLRLEMTGPRTGRIVDPEGVLRRQDVVEAAIEITGGRGSGQIRMIARRDGEVIELDKPWRVAPDHTSKVCFVAPAPFHQLNFVDNHIENTGPAIILWGSSNDVMVDGNRISYSPGIGIYSVNLSDKLERIWGGAYFTQVVNNTLDVGMFQPDAETILDHKHESLPQHGVIANMSYLPSEDYDFLGLIVRNNCTKNNTGIIIKKTFRQDNGTSAVANDAGMVVEGNYACDSVAGIVIEDGAASVDRGNRAERVRWPMIRFDRKTDKVRFLSE
ncbi:MAG: hypothetical protein V1800_02120 [Candidatus Latescibacterota bacterium]